MFSEARISPPASWMLSGARDRGRRFEMRGLLGTEGTVRRHEKLTPWRRQERTPPAAGST